MALIVVVKVAIVAAVLALPSWFAMSLGAAHGVALALVVVAAAGLLVVGAIRRGKAALTAEARVETANASRYLVQLCRHATKMGDRRVRGVEFTDTHGTLDLSWGRCTLDADADTLTVRVEAGAEKDLRTIQDIVAADLRRFGHRDDLTVTWTPAHRASPHKTTHGA